MPIRRPIRGLSRSTEHNDEWKDEWCWASARELFVRGKAHDSAHRKAHLHCSQNGGLHGLEYLLSVVRWKNMSSDHTFSKKWTFLHTENDLFRQSKFVHTIKILVHTVKILFTLLRFISHHWNFCLHHQNLVHTITILFTLQNGVVHTYQIFIHTM